jgi:hypothetical protein
LRAGTDNLSFCMTEDDMAGPVLIVPDTKATCYYFQVLDTAIAGAAPHLREQLSRIL